MNMSACIFTFDVTFVFLGFGYLYVEKRLTKIFKEEMESDDSIFCKVSNSAVHKIALFLSGKMARACSIGIAGETASDSDIKLATVAASFLGKQMES